MGEKKVVPIYLISALTVIHLIRDRCEAYLANILDITKVSLRVREVPVVKDYPNVFLDELPRLPPY